MMLKMEGVHAHYGHIHALRGIDVEVQVGEIVTLIGANGAGKSTLMMSLFGNPKASAGRIVFDGEDITRVHTHEIARRGIALVPEGRRIFPRMTVIENLQMGTAHADPANYYPYFWGHAHEAGTGEGDGFNLNLPLPLGSADAPWLAAGDTALTRIAAFAPTALVVALGLDASESDPLQGLKVTGAGFHAMATRIARLGLPTVLVQEGGYLGDDLGRNLVQFLAGFEKERNAAPL